VKPVLTFDGVQVFHGDCIEVMRSLPDNSVDSIVTDPPYGLEFMGKEWDAPWKDSARWRSASKLPGSHSTQPTPRPQGWGNAGLPFQEWSQAWATEALRVLKPGGHLLAFGGTRTWHRLAVAIEDAGFEVRDSIAWMYGSGFPKSLDVSKAIDKRGGTSAEFASFRDDVKEAMQRNSVTRSALQGALGNFMLSHYLTAGSQPAVPNLRDYQIIRDTVGLGDKWDAAFNAEAEREVVGKSGHKSGIANGVEGHHTVGGTRAEHYDITAPATPAAQQWQGFGTALKPAFEPIVVARKPLIGTVAENVLAHGTGALNIDGCRIGTSGATTRSAQTEYGQSGWRTGHEVVPIDAGRWPANVILDESQAAELDKQSGVTKDGVAVRHNGVKGGEIGAPGAKPEGTPDMGYGGQGGASRFFYCAKAPKKERPNVDGIAHPTVKPLKLMEYLVRLVTPPGGTVLEPFAGSGATIEAAISQGFQVIAIEQEWDYIRLIEARLNKPIQGAL
jgi:DNA modification methylase